MRIRKLVSIFTAAALCAAMLTACGKSDDSGSGEKLTVVTTIFPEYDWVRNIMGSHAEDAEIIYLLQNGVDLHSYQPTADDILTISGCDMFIYAGGESDSWVDGALENASNDDMQVIKLLDVVGSAAKTEEVKEGMQAEEEEEDTPAYDEHVWLSLRNAETICTEIEKSLEKLDPDNAEDYKKNLEAYTAELDKLDKEYETAVSSASTKTILFGDRFPFRYLTDDYGLDYYAAFVGCSAETEASFETVAFLAKKVDELGLKYIFTIENSDGKLANTIIENTRDKDQQVLALNSLQSVTNHEDEDYLALMRDNLETLKKALN